MSFLTVVLAFFLLPFSLPPAAHAGRADVVLDVTLEPAAGRLHGTVAMEVDAREAATVDLAAVEVMAARLAGEVVSVDGPTLEVPPAPVARRLEIDFRYQPGENDDNLLGPDGVVLVAPWHPAPAGDHPYALTVRLPAGLVPVSEADTVVRETDGALARYTFSLAQPRPGLSLVAGPYQVQEEKIGDVTVASYFYPEDEALADRYRRRAGAEIQRFSDHLGPFPYRRFAIVENPLPTGYAFPSYTLLGRQVARLPFITETSLVHEIVHQWFGNAVEVDGSNWAEGLASYLADHAAAVERDEGERWRKDQLLRYQSWVRPENAKSLREFYGAGLEEADAVQVARAMGYGKGAMVFHMLRRRLGDDAFWAGLADLYRRLRFRRAGWSDLQTSFEEAGHDSLAGFFQQWLERSDVPQLEVKDLALTYPDGVPTVSFTLRQGTETPYQLVVPVSFVGEGWEIQKIVQTDTSAKEVAIPLERVPRYMLLDPRYDLMRALHPSEFEPVWWRFAGSGARLAVMAADIETGLYEALAAMARQMGAQVMEEAQVSDADVAGHDTLFLGCGPLCRSLFADPGHPADGATVEVRANPLDLSRVAVLATVHDVDAGSALAGKLRHYGSYAYLHLQGRRVVEKRRGEAATGMVYGIDQPPAGVKTDTPNSFGRLMDEIGRHRVVYVGESHTAVEDHDLQLRVIQDLYRRDPRLAVGMEMFARSAQPVLDDYIGGRLDEKELLKQSRYFQQWGYDWRYYRDILAFARRHRIPVLGLNADKKTVSTVYRGGGLAALAEEERAALPVERDLSIPGYPERIRAIYTMHGGHGGPAAQGSYKDFIQSQGVWDETMAETAAMFLADHPDHRLVILAGRGHVVRDTGIPPRLARRLPEVDQVVVATLGMAEIDPREVDYVFFAQPRRLPPAPMLGVQLAESDDGVRVTGVVRDRPAAKAGVEEGDVLVRLNDTPVNDIGDVKLFLLDRHPGETVRLGLRRKVLFGWSEVELPCRL